METLPPYAGTLLIYGRLLNNLILQLSPIIKTVPPAIDLNLVSLRLDTFPSEFNSIVSRVHDMLKRYYDENSFDSTHLNRKVFDLVKQFKEVVGAFREYEEKIEAAIMGERKPEHNHLYRQILDDAIENCPQLLVREKNRSGTLQGKFDSLEKWFRLEVLQSAHKKMQAKVKVEQAAFIEERKEKEIIGMLEMMELEGDFPGQCTTCNLVHTTGKGDPKNDYASHTAHSQVARILSTLDCLESSANDVSDNNFSESQLDSDETVSDPEFQALGANTAGRRSYYGAITTDLSINNAHASAVDNRDAFGSFSAPEISNATRGISNTILPNNSVQSAFCKIYQDDSPAINQQKRAHTRSIGRRRRRKGKDGLESL